MSNTNPDDLPSSPFKCVFDLFNVALFISMVVVGIVKWPMCPIEPFIPRALLGTGLAFLALWILEKATHCCNKRSNARTVLEPLIKFILVSILFLTFVTLLVLIGRSAKANSYCDPGLYYFTIFIIIVFIVEIFVLVGHHCYVRRKSGQEDPESIYRT